MHFTPHPPPLYILRVSDDAFRDFFSLWVCLWERTPVCVGVCARESKSWWRFSTLFFPEEKESLLTSCNRLAFMGLLEEEKKPGFCSSLTRVSIQQFSFLLPGSTWLACIFPWHFWSDLPRGCLEKKEKGSASFFVTPGRASRWILCINSVYYLFVFVPGHMRSAVVFRHSVIDFSPRYCSSVNGKFLFVTFRVWTSFVLGLFLSDLFG